jgi:hypothetical protein
MQLRILKVLHGAGWLTRDDMEQAGAGRKGYSRALGAPTTGPLKDGTLEKRGFVKRMDGPPQFQYIITTDGKEALKEHERLNGEVLLRSSGPKAK